MYSTLLFYILIVFVGDSVLTSMLGTSIYSTLLFYMLIVFVGDSVLTQVCVRARTRW
jgi:hypothetical protein